MFNANRLINKKNTNDISIGIMARAKQSKNKIKNTKCNRILSFMSTELGDIALTKNNIHCNIGTNNFDKPFEEEKSKSEIRLLNVEKRFKKTCGITYDISHFPISTDISNIKINKSKSKEFGEVFTPLWLADEMISQINFDTWNIKTLDLCAGYGQFSVRLMRYMHERFTDFDSLQFTKNHSFSELQLSSCYKLLNTFGVKINLFIGDSTYLNKLPPNAHGIWAYIESYGYWVCLTKTIISIMAPDGLKNKLLSEEDFSSSVESLVQSLNETYTNIKNMITEIKFSDTQTVSIKSEKARLLILSTINRITKDVSSQSVDTPKNIINDMLSCVNEIEKKSILVLYNAEIIEQLVFAHKIPIDQITFATDSESALKAGAVRSMYDVATILFSKDPSEMHSAFTGKKFDVCLSNPPYNNGIDLKIIRAITANGSIEKSIAKELVIVHPSTWLLDQKGISKSYKDFKASLDGKIKSIKLFNGNPVFSISLFLPCSITHIDLNHDSSEIDVTYFKEKFIAESIADVTKFGKQWLLIVKPLVDKIKKFVDEFSDVWSHNEKSITHGKFYCQSAAIRGHVSFNSSAMVIDDFYTMIYDLDKCKNIRQPNLNRPGNPTPTWSFNTESERDNFLNYLRTDFARFCLSFLKNNGNLAVGEMNLIPWLDFTQPWNDEKLFKHFDVNEETQNYIRNFLPDYHNIRN